MSYRSCICKFTYFYDFLHYLLFTLCATRQVDVSIGGHNTLEEARQIFFSFEGDWFPRCADVLNAEQFNLPGRGNEEMQELISTVVSKVIGLVY